MNISKLKKLKKWILDEPRRYNQNFWLCGSESITVREQKPSCGTAACLAGNACLMEGYVPVEKNFHKSDFVVKPGSDKKYYIKILATKILGLNEDQADKLFAVEGLYWNTAARDLYQRATTLRDRAKAAAMAIDALIKQGRQSRKAPKRGKVAN